MRLKKEGEVGEVEFGPPTTHIVHGDMEPSETQLFSELLDVVVAAEEKAAEADKCRRRHEDERGRAHRPGRNLNLGHGDG